MWLLANPWSVVRRAIASVVMFGVAISAGASASIAQSQAIILDASHFSEVCGEHRNYRVFLPPNYGQSSPKRYPVVVYVWWTAHANRSTRAPYKIVHAGGTFTTTRNQQTGGGQWQLLGTFRFATGTAGYVEVSDVNGQVSADAVRFSPR